MSRHPIHPHPEWAIIGCAEHFGLIRRGDDSKSVNCSHVTSKGPHLLFRLNVPHLERTCEHLNSHDHCQKDITVSKKHCWCVKKESKVTKVMERQREQTSKYKWSQKQTQALWERARHSAVLFTRQRGNHVHLPYMDEVFISATDDVVVSDSDGVDAAPTGL